jgi:peptidyl-prolyl cis-trans isomerase B (cyclophilin B)
MSKTVELQTSAGVIRLELDDEKAPKSTENFLTYAQDGHYDGTIFHRVIKGFMIQGGGLDSAMSQKRTRAAIVNEADNGLKNKRYTVAMARTGDPHSATAQFFINTTDNDFLDFRSPVDGRTWGYAVFGKVTAGHDVVDKIEGTATGRKGMYEDVPRETITIERVVVVA